MHDEFAGNRLPDIPNAGYQTPREKALSDEIMFFIRGCERNRKLLLSIVRDGKRKFRQIGRKAWSHLRVDTEMCDAVWGYLALLSGHDPKGDEGLIRESANRQLTTLEVYDAQSMAQRIHFTNEAFLRKVHSKLKH